MILGAPIRASKPLTDQDGKYRITDVPAGNYQVAPVTPAFVISDANKSYGQSLIIAEGDNVAGIDFDLMKGGVITGKVTDADGHPVMEERLTLLAAVSAQRCSPMFGLTFKQTIEAFTE